MKIEDRYEEKKKKITSYNKIIITFIIEFGIFDQTNKIFKTQSIG